MRILVATAATAALLLAACGGGTSPASSHPSTPAPATDIGKPVSIGDGVTITVTGVSVHNQDTPPYTQYGPNDLWVAMRVINHGNRPYQVSGFSFKLVDSAGNEHSLGENDVDGLSDFGVGEVVPAGGSLNGGMYFAITAGQGLRYTLSDSDRSMQTSMGPLPTWKLGTF